VSFQFFPKRPAAASQTSACLDTLAHEENFAPDETAIHDENTQSQRFNRQLWNSVIALAKPYWFSERKKIALGLLGVLLALMLGVNGLNVAINFISGSFMTALQEKNAPEFYKMLAMYFGIFVVGTPIVVFYSFVQDKLGLRWREWMTNHLMDKYFQNRTYYHINNDSNLDNPDERLAQDVNSFCKTALSFTLTILGSIITFCSFITILWKISTPLVFIVVVYAMLGTIATYLMGRRLMGLNFNQLKKEANFRYGLIHVRNNTESIAFYRGEEQEKRQVKRRFADAIFNFNLLIGWTRNLGFVTTGYNYMIVLIPALVIAPIYFAGKVKFGVFTQADMAFSQILSALSLVVTSFSDLSNFAAVTNRLSGFTQALEPEFHAPRNEGHSVIDTVEDVDIKLQELTLTTPQGDRVLVKELSAAVPEKSSLLIVGPSGSGKSSLLRAIAGLWNNGNGEITRPALNQVMFLPQRPYMILGTLRKQLLYPSNAQVVSDEELRAVLRTVNLASLPERVGGFDTEINFSDLLSLGEQQRLAFARLLLIKPAYAILDEATSALDVSNEEQLYRQLLDGSTTVVSVGHRPTLVNYHDKVLELVGDANWRVLDGKDYAASINVARQVESVYKSMANAIAGVAAVQELPPVASSSGAIEHETMIASSPA
jgi:putative ATP-binding cassette transporter